MRGEVVADRLDDDDVEAMHGCAGNDCRDEPLLEGDLEFRKEHLDYAAAAEGTVLQHVWEDLYHGRGQKKRVPYKKAHDRTFVRVLHRVESGSRSQFGVGGGRGEMGESK